jgi:hypothetical protein
VNEFDEECTTECLDDSLNKDEVRGYIEEQVLAHTNKEITRCTIPGMRP